MNTMPKKCAASETPHRSDQIGELGSVHSHPIENPKKELENWFDPATRQG